MYEFLGIDFKTLNYGVFQCCQTGLIRNVLEATGVKHCNGLPTPTNLEAHTGTYDNGSEAKRDWPNSYASVIGIMFYMELKKYQISHFLFTIVTGFHMNRICRYLQGIKDNGLVF